MLLINTTVGKWVVLLALAALMGTVDSTQEPSWCSTTSSGNDSSSSTGLHFKILPMGASLVYGQESSDGNGFRLGLQNLLEANGSQATMVGTQWSGNMTDNHHEAYKGVTIDEYNNKSYHSGAYSLDANVVLILIGTNDCWYIKDDGGDSDDPRFGAGLVAAQRFANLLGSIRDKASNALVLASTLPYNTNDWEDRCIQGFNSVLPTVVKNATEKGQQVRLVDMYDVVPKDQMQEDGTHPTDYGYQLMAKQWYSALANATADVCVQEKASTTASASATSGAATEAAQSASPSVAASGAGILSPYDAFWPFMAFAAFGVGCSSW